MKCYKLTESDFTTKNNTLWGENVTHKIKRVDPSQDLCSEYWLHAYEDSRIASLLNAAHGNFSNPVLWEAKADGKFKYDGQCKFGCTKLTTIKRMELPKISTEKRVEFAIRCALAVYHNDDFKNWADGWISGKNRCAAAAAAAAYAAAAYAAYAACAAAYAAAYAAVAYAAYAAYAADAAAAAADAAAIDLYKIMDACGIAKEEA